MRTHPATKILIFCPPFDGHLNVIKQLVKNRGNHFECNVIITGWNNIPVDTATLDCKATLLAKSDLSETDPALWTFPRVAELLDDCLAEAKAYRPDLILYDFFSLEGNLVGKLLDIPAWSSIPAFMGGFKDREYLARKLDSANNITALNALRKQYSIAIDTDGLEMISDGIHLPGEVNIVWSYQSITPRDYMTNRNDNHYIFVGSARGPVIRQPHNKRRPVIYVSFGTVVMNNLWNQQKEVRQHLTEFLTELAIIWQDKPWDIVFVTQGKNILEHYPNNWMIKKTLDQFETLSQSDVFVTHGGSNSFHEAFVTQTPMVVIPFFGDQPLVAQTVAKLGLGINLVPGASIDTRASKQYLNKNLAKSLDEAVQKVLADPSYITTVKNMNLGHTDIFTLFDRKIRFNEGDLLYGTNVARQRYIAEHKLQKEFTILEFKAFSELAPHSHSLPRIVDIYHDVILNDEYFAKDSSSGMQQYTKHLSEYKRYLAGETDFEKMCLKGLDFFTQYHTVHFILSDFDPNINTITGAEINYVLQNKERFEGRVIFYQELRGHWVPIPYSHVNKTGSRSQISNIQPK